MSNTRKRGRRKPQRKINQKMKEKLVILFGLVLLALVVLILRITFINATDGRKYKKQVLSQAQQKYESHPAFLRKSLCMPDCHFQIG